MIKRENISIKINLENSHSEVSDSVNRSENMNLSSHVGLTPCDIDGRR